MKVIWDLTHLYKDDADWQTDFDLLINNVSKLNEMVSSCINSEDDLLRYLRLFFETSELIENVFCYAKRHVDLDFTLEDYQKKMNETLSVHSEILSVNNKFENLLIENKDRVLSYLNSNDLKYYERYIFLILRRDDYIIKDPELIRDYSNYTKELQSLKDRYRVLTNEKIKFKTININGEDVEVNRKTYDDLITDKKQENRKKVFDSYTDAFGDIINEIFEIYKEKLKLDINVYKMEGYKSLLAKKLFELELDENVVINLIDTITSNLEVMHRYINLKKKLTEIDNYHMYDASVSICDIPKIEYDFEEAVNIIKNALSVLGDDYIEVVDRMFNEGWVDVYPRDNKRSMSFTCISYVGVPYILLNYNNSFTSLKTAAHEIGHGYQVNASKDVNDYVYFEFSYFLTEIASKVNELLVSEYMVNNVKSKEEKKYILNFLISNLGNSLFSQVMLTEFEHMIINMLDDGDISLETTNNLYENLVKKYNGDSIIHDDNVKYGWSKIPHFVMQDTYYVYQYSIGMAIATDIARRILNQEEGFVEKYKKFLSLGNSVSINEALGLIGISLENEDYINGAIKVLSKKIDDLEQLFE